MSSQTTNIASKLGIKTKQPWVHFLPKAFAVLVVLYLIGVWFSSRFLIVGDPQEVKCLPGYSVYLVDKKDQRIERGELYMFLSKDLSPIYSENTKMLKFMRGLPGDLIEVRSNSQVFINGNASEAGLSLAPTKLGRKESDFHGKTTLGEDEFWFLGTSPKSFDSRYWGSIHRDKIVGRAYALF
jgi:conjugal transfer pilin signal peptidase TrbI